MSDRTSIRPATPADVPLILALVRELAEYERAPDAVHTTEALIRRRLFPHDAPRAGGTQPDATEPHAKTSADAAVAPTAAGRDAGVPSPLAECLIGEVEGVAQGFAVFFHNYSTWTGRPGLYLEDLFVRPAARGQGLGKALLCRLAKLALERGCARFEWVVLDWNEPALRFYRALGAEPLTEWTVHRVSGEALRKLAEQA